MPSLVLFGRRTLFAGDDLRLWAFLSTATKIVQIGFCVPLMLFLFRNGSLGIKEACDTTNARRLVKHLYVLLHVYVTASLVMAVVSLCLDGGIWFLSGTGTPTIPGKRTRIRSLCHVNLTILVLFRPFLLFLGLVLESTFTTYCACGIENDDLLGAKWAAECKPQLDAYSELVVLVKTQLSELCFTALVAIYFGCRCLGGTCRRVSPEDQWKCFCRCCCTFSSVLTCCLLGGRDSVTGDFSDVAIILADYFDGGGHLDVVPSDIVMGLLMLSRVQAQIQMEAEAELNRHTQDMLHVRGTNKENRKSTPHTSGTSMNGGETMNQMAAMLARQTASSGQCISDDSVGFRMQRCSRGHVSCEPHIMNILRPDNLTDRSAIAEGARYMRLSLAIYTWAMKSLNHPCTGLCEVIAISTGTAIRECCKKHAQFVSDNPCRFHQTALMKEAGLEETEVVFAQFQVGFAATPYCIVLDHDWKSIVVAIRGTQSTDDLLADMTLRPVSLEKLGELCNFDGKDRYAHAGMLACSEWIYRDIEREGKLAHVTTVYPTYELRITGHSLGAGCATILAILLRPKYLSVRVLAFSPPGCVMTKNVADESKSYTTSYVLDCDIVPRLSLQSIENFRNDVLDMIDQTKVPKNSVLNGKSRADSLASANRKNLHDPDSIPQTPFHIELEAFRSEYTTRRAIRDFRELELWPPGKIVHMIKTGHDKKRSCVPGCSKITKNYVSCWADACIFREIRMSHHLLKDHQPDNILRELETLAQTFGLEAPYYEAYVNEGDV